MSQPQLTTDLDVPENPQHSCQCSAMSSMDSMRAQRERGVGSTRISNSQELPRGLEALQSAFEPIRRLESPLSHHHHHHHQQEGQQMNLESGRNADMLEHQANVRSMEGQGAILSRHGHNLSCSPRNLDLSRNLAFEAARRVQESGNNLQDNNGQPSGPSSPLLESAGPALLAETKDLDKQLEDHGGVSLSQKAATTSGKDKLKTSIQQVLNPYQHHHEAASAERNTVHGHFHGDAHAHVHKHADNFRGGANLDVVGDGLMGFQQHGQRQHTHHHHAKSTGVAGGHHHGPTAVHHSHVPPREGIAGHHHGNLATHVHGNVSAPSSQNSTGNPGGHHHPNPSTAATTATTTTTMIHRNSPTNHHRLAAHYPSNSGFSSDHHGTSSAMSGASSNSSMLNHGGSPAVHRHVVNANSSLSTTPLASHHHGSSSGSLTGHSSVNHHHVSSGISCESSSSNANTRAHSRLDHVHDHHHHLQQVHSLHPSHPDAPRQRDARAPSSLEHHGHHHGHVHAHAHQHPQNNDTKNTSIIGVDSIQVSAPSKSKCQCHVVQTGGNKRGQEGESDGGVEVTSRTHQPPALPPRPPPRPTRRYETTSVDQCHTGEGGCCKKYVVLCCLCGGLSAAVGSLFLAVHAVLSAHTASLALFETVPSYIPGIMLILMGLFTMLLARRKHRYGLLMKVCGSVGVVCALVCVLVTVTTTVIHMSRLQGLRKCVYTVKARSCTCYGAPEGDPGVLFEGTPHCEAVHGALHACLRALFGVSVAGILACIFSCMLVYQLLSHEKKKMYWEQLELRCRSLYGQGGGVGPTSGSCGCCNDCGGASPWWAQTPGNLYTPNPDLAPSRRWRLPWSRSRGPAPSPDSNYGFHTQARQTEANVESTNGPYSVLNSQSSGPYSVLNTQNGPYTPSTASYSVLETPVPLWGPPPPYSDPNSPARRPQVAEQRPRIAKRIENFENNEDHRSRAAKRPSDNYENAEEISNSTDPEGGNEGGTMKGTRRARKPLKGVENGAFQQEANAGPKQSESELYFGDVSSCCGPESSFYDLAVEKEGTEHSEGVDYLAARLGKRQLSKRSRMPLPLPSDGGDIPSDNYANSDEPRSARGPFLAPDAQYEVIQQGRYSYYAAKDDEQLQEGAATSGYFREEEAERGREYRDYRSSQEEETPQCCLSDSTTLDSGWQSGEQQQSDDNVRPVNV
ncbi:uncharacterized protein LOC100863156 [Apis florea]|uniref:uncharacterized protein LOC100863156 n=1 Tax=Apis florea TaxID=7463 RepID=UPI000629ACB9|nr:uncharacterized protein LOC100863156 [Apis florea]